MRSMRIIHVGAYHNNTQIRLVRCLIQQFMQYTGSNIVMACIIIKHLLRRVCTEHTLG